MNYDEESELEPDWAECLQAPTVDLTAAVLARLDERPALWTGWLVFRRLLTASALATYLVLVCTLAYAISQSPPSPTLATRLADYWAGASNSAHPLDGGL